MRKYISLTILTAITLATTCVNAAETKTEKAVEPTPNKSVNWDNFTCKSNREATLESLKEDLLDLCDLNRPFSITESGTIAGSGKMTFCCHKKK